MPTFVSRSLPAEQSTRSSRRRVTSPSAAPVLLGPVDGFDQDEGASESDECAIAVLGFVAAQGNSLEALQLADRLLSPGAGLVEQSREEAGPVLGILAVGNNRDNAATTASCAVGR
jgi:hypothetical protein